MSHLTMICKCCKTNKVYNGIVKKDKRKVYCRNCARTLWDMQRRAYSKGYNRGLRKGRENVR